MFTSLDLLIIVVMVLTAISLLALALMFLIRNRKVRQVCLYIVAALGAYMGYVGFRINWPGFTVQAILAVVLALTAVAAVVLERRFKDRDQQFGIARIMVALSLIVGMINAFM